MEELERTIELLEDINRMIEDIIKTLKGGSDVCN